MNAMWRRAQFKKQDIFQNLQKTRYAACCFWFIIESGCANQCLASLDCFGYSCFVLFFLKRFNIISEAQKPQVGTHLRKGCEILQQKTNLNIHEGLLGSDSKFFQFNKYVYIAK